jgi:hypothetical protein
MNIPSKTNVSIETWSVKRNADGSVMRDGKGEPVLDMMTGYQRIHNTTATVMLNYKTFYAAHATATKPVNRVKFLYASGASSAYGTTTYTNASYATSWLSSWLNDTGSSQTVATIRLVNMSSVGDVIFCTATPAQVVAANEVMRVTWTHTHTTSGTPAVENTFLTMLMNCLTGAIATSYPFLTAKFTGAGGAVNVALGTPFSGGSLADTTVVWKPKAEALAGTTQLTRFDLYSALEDPVYSKTSLTEGWTVGQSITATVTVTMT